MQASPDISSERLIKAAFSAISVVISITYKAEGTRPYDRRVYQNKAQISGPGRTGRRGPVRRRRDHLRRRWRALARSGAADPDSGPAERVLHRLSRLGSSRTPGGGVDQTAGAGAVPGLRGPQRPRRVVPGPAPGAVVRPGRPDGGVPARGVGSRQTAGRQEHSEPTGADSVGGTGGRVQENRGRPGGDGRAAAGGVCGSASGAPGGGDPGCRRHGRSAAWEAGGTVLPRLLQTLLLPATVRLLWGTPVACAAAHGGSRRGPRGGGGVGTNREAAA